MKKTKRKYQQKEKKIQLQVCDWLKETYPHLLFMCDLSSGMRLSIGQAMIGKRMRSSSGLPDLYIFHRGYLNNCSGMVLELKKSPESIYLKNGNLRKSKHIQQQNENLLKFSEHGYYANFGTSFEHCKFLIDGYLNGLFNPVLNSDICK